MQLDNMLLQACKNNKKSVVQTFLKRGGIDVNKRDESGNTPLIYVCMKNARDLVKLLLDKDRKSGSAGTIRTACPFTLRRRPATRKSFPY